MAAVRRLRPPARLIMVGNGDLLDEVRGTDTGHVVKEVITDLPHERMAEAYAEMDVLVLPSRSTPTWQEQFGRVMVEAMWCGVPVIGSDSGEIPWVISTTGGGLLYPEGDTAALYDRIERLRSEEGLAAHLAAEGRQAVQRQFGVEAVAARLSAALESAARERRTR
jgi:glycosyltransferase involved in cell wall biosynthesis